MFSFDKFLFTYLFYLPYNYIILARWIYRSLKNNYPSKHVSFIVKSAVIAHYSLTENIYRSHLCNFAASVTRVAYVYPTNPELHQFEPIVSYCSRAALF